MIISGSVSRAMKATETFAPVLGPCVLIGGAEPATQRHPGRESYAGGSFGEGGDLRATA